MGILGMLEGAKHVRIDVYATGEARSIHLGGAAWPK